MSDTQIIGGIQFYTKDIIEVNTKEDQFSVILTDGTTLEYELQPEEREAEVIIRDTGRVDFNGLINAIIKDSPNNDIYHLSGCENVIVEADRGLMKIKDKIIGADQDLIDLKNRILKNGKMQYSKLNVLKLNKCDLYQLPNETSINYIDNDSVQINEE